VKPAVLSETLEAAEARLLEEKSKAGFWTGDLSTSALATATALCALGVYDPERYKSAVEKGLSWLERNANPDGGWGDTILSKSNLSTTTLCWFALRRFGGDRFAGQIRAAETYLRSEAGGLSTAALVEAISRRYGKDKTFSVPILTMGAVCSCVPWKEVPSLPFELASVPSGFFRFLRLPVVSYAIPALVAVGQARFRKAPPRNPLTYMLRSVSVGRTLHVLQKMQPSSGGFLEAVPITSFVAMSLVEAGLRDQPVARLACSFLQQAARPDGSWPIEKNLATWLTTLSVNALCENGGKLEEGISRAVRFWLLRQQHMAVHPYTGAKPGGWAWTDLPGGVPDADDTAGAVLALSHLGADLAEVRRAAFLGLSWLCGLQNRDGGIPTFCRGWGHLPFDRSGPDLAAHSLRAFNAWEGRLRGFIPPRLLRRMQRWKKRLIDYLLRTQRADGSWVPLWFGNEHHPQEESPTYGTARVLQALSGLISSQEGLQPALASAASSALEWLLRNQNSDGGWGAGYGTPSSLEETGLALEALSAAGSKNVLVEFLGRRAITAVREAVERGAFHLVEATCGGKDFQPAPIGFYFAKLWYYEKLYPVIFTVAGLRSAEAFLRAEA